MDASALASIRNLVDRSVPLNLYAERALLAEIDRLNATIQRVRDVLAKWEATQARNRQIFNNPAWFHIEPIDCTGDLHRALEGGEQ